MTTVVSRTFRSTPHRSGGETWSAIVSLLTRGRESTAATELRSVAGIATSLIVDQAVVSAPIVVTCSGPRTRIYCVHDDDSLDDSTADEGPLGFDPLEGDWKVSLPCRAEDLAWVARSLKAMSERITARDMAEGIAVSESTLPAADSAPALKVNLKELLK